MSRSIVPVRFAKLNVSKNLSAQTKSKDIKSAAQRRAKYSLEVKLTIWMQWEEACQIREILPPHHGRGEN